MAKRSLLLLAVILAAMAASPGVASAQKRCTKGIPCGNTCIAANKTCRVGSGSATKAPASKATPSTQPPSAIPEGAQYVASSKGQVYYWVGCNAWKQLSKANLIYFKTSDEAQKAGYRPSASAGCAGPVVKPDSTVIKGPMPVARIDRDRSVYSPGKLAFSALAAIPPIRR